MLMPVDDSNMHVMTQCRCILTWAQWCAPQVTMPMQALNMRRCADVTNASLMGTSIRVTHGLSAAVSSLLLILCSLSCCCHSLFSCSNAAFQKGVFTLYCLPIPFSERLEAVQGQPSILRLLCLLLHLVACCSSKQGLTSVQSTVKEQGLASGWKCSAALDSGMFARQKALSSIFKGCLGSLKQAEAPTGTCCVWA